MKRISHTGRQIRELIEMINASAERTEVFAEACERLEKVIGFNSAVLLAHGPPESGFLQAGTIVLNHQSKDAQLYIEHYAPLDPIYTDWVANLANLNIAARNTDLVSARQLQDSEFVCDFLRRVPAFWVMGGLLAHKGVVVGAFAIHRPRGDRDFSNHDKDVINCVFPFFARALYLIEHPQLVSRDLQSDLNERLHALKLTPCEAQILRLVLSGRLYREIASDLRVHVQTVKKHMSDILAKAEVRNRHELAARLSGLQWVNKGA